MANALIRQRQASQEIGPPAMASAFQKALNEQLPESGKYPSNVILASVGSKDTEFDVRGLKELAMRSDHIGDHIVKYTLPSSKNVMVVKRGAAVNFIIASMPIEIMDLVFSEIVISAIRLVKTPDLFPVGQVNVAPDMDLSNISKEWLKYVNH